MRILITGATGFLGSRLLRAIVADGHDCFALFRGNVPALPAGTTPLAADCRDRDAVREAFAAARPDVVFHCAMTSGHPVTAERRIEALGTSVMGTAVLLEAALEARVTRFVFTGSFLVYAPQPRPLRESDPLDPSGFRGGAKAGASLWVQQFARHAGLSTVELRIFSIYGPGEADHRFIPALLRTAKNGGTLPLLCGPRHDFVYVDDVVAACRRAAEADVAPGAIFNIGSGRTWANEDVVAAARRVTGRLIPVREGAYPAGPADAAHWQADISSARKELGWEPQYEIEAGLANMYEWMCRK